MNTRKIAIVYTYLFLFAFAFALGFNMNAKADGGQVCGCCETYCATDPNQIEVMGHVDKQTGLCTGLANDCQECDHFTYQCPPEGGGK